MSAPAPVGTLYGYTDRHGVVRPLHQLADWPAADIDLFERWIAPEFADGSHGPWQRLPREGQSDA